MAIAETTFTDTTVPSNDDSEGNEDEEESYDPTLSGIQVADDLERCCPDCDSELVYELNELVCTGCAYTPAVVRERRSKRDEWERLWEERNRLSDRTGPRRKRCVAGFERAYEDDYEM